MNSVILSLLCAGLSVKPRDMALDLGVQILELVKSAELDHVET
jgi:hypothetical protein